MPRTSLALFAAAITIGVPALASDMCDQRDANEKWRKAETAGIILGMGMMNDIPTISIDESAWDGASLNTRTGLITTFECLVAGPGKALRSIQVVNRGGRLLATYDGIRKSIDVRQ